MMIANTGGGPKNNNSSFIALIFFQCFVVGGDVLSAFLAITFFSTVGAPLAAIGGGGLAAIGLFQFLNLESLFGATVDLFVAVGLLFVGLNAIIPLLLLVSFVCLYSTGIFPKAGMGMLLFIIFCFILEFIPILSLLPIMSLGFGLYVVLSRIKK